MARTIYLYGEVGWEFTDKSFAEELDAIPADERALIAINSPGGDVFVGQAIAALIKARGGVDVRIDGLAASAITYPAIAGETVTISSGGMFMIHSPLSVAYGNARDFRELADLLDKVEDSVIIPAYVRKTEKDSAELKALMDAETWFSADEAVEMGFADSLSDTPAVLNRLPAKFANIYRNIPENLRPVGSPQEGAPVGSRIRAFRDSLQPRNDSKGRGEPKEEPKEPVKQEVGVDVYQARLRLLKLST